MKKNFFKNDFFKCITVLLIIMVIAGGLLAILNDVLYVSPEERLNRAVQKVYGKTVEAEKEEIREGFNYDKGTIENIYSFTDEGKDYLLFKSTGNEGYKNGTVTLWLLVPCKDGEPEKIQKVVLDGYSKQTLMSALTGKFYGYYAELDMDEVRAGKLITADSKADPMVWFVNPTSGATKSSNAANNAVNTVLVYLWGQSA